MTEGQTVLCPPGRARRGRKKGQHEKAIEIAIKALDKLDNETIVQLTGLSLNEVVALRAVKSEK